MHGLIWILVFAGISAAQPVTFTATAAFSTGEARYVLGTAPNTISVEFVPSGTQTVDAGQGFLTTRLLQVRVEVAGNPFQIPLGVPAQPFAVTIVQLGSAGSASLSGSMAMAFSGSRPVLNMNFNTSDNFTLSGVTYSWQDTSLQLWDAFFPSPPSMLFDLNGRITRGQVTLSPSSLDVTVTAGAAEMRTVTVNVPGGGSFFLSGTDGVYGFQSGPNTAQVSIQNSLLFATSASVVVQVIAPGYPPANLVVRVNYVPGTNFISAAPRELNFFYTRGGAPPSSQSVNVSSSDVAIIQPNTWDANWLIPTQAGNTVTAQALLTNKGPGNHRTHVILRNNATQRTDFFSNFFVNDGPGAVNVSIQPAAAGTAQVTPQQYVTGTRVSLRFVPQAGSGFVFARWSGAVNDTANPVSFVVNGPMNITAVLVPITGACTYTLNPAKAYVPATGDTARVEIQTQPGCPWSVSELPSWVTLLTPGVGSGPGFFLFSALSNGLGAFVTPGREAFVRVQDAYLMVLQSGAPCQSFWAAIPALVAATGGDVPMRTSVTDGCGYTPVPSQSWLSVPATGGAYLMGMQFNVQAAPNDTGVPRAGAILMGGSRVPVLQRAATPVAPFNDVSVDHLFADHIMTLKRNGAADSCGSGLYCPENLMLRSQMAELLIRTLLHTEDFPLATTVSYFTDVPATHPQFKWIQKIAELGITNGCSGTRFCPDDPVTRGQMAAFLVRARLGINAQTEVTAASPRFVDVQTPNIFAAAIGKLREWGVTTGCHVNAYCPNEYTTRGQMAAFLVRAFFAP